MTKNKTTRIYWTEAEWETLTEEAAAIMNESGTGPLNALRRAQASLPEDRRRIQLGNTDEIRLKRIKEKAELIRSTKKLEQMTLPDPAPEEQEDRLTDCMRGIQTLLEKNNALLATQNKHLVAIGHATNIGIGHIAGHRHTNGNGKEPDRRETVVAALVEALQRI